MANNNAGGTINADERRVNFGTSRPSDAPDAQGFSDPRQADNAPDPIATAERAVIAWVVQHVSEWRNHRVTNFDERWEQYRNLWRGQWTAGNAPGSTPWSAGSGASRSKFISPAVAQAVDSSVAEIEEASFGRGKPFVLEARDGATDTKDVTDMEPKLQEDLEAVFARTACSEAVINAAIFGTGILEMYVEHGSYQFPQQRPSTNQPGVNQVGVAARDKVKVCWRAVQPNNFVIDPNSATINDSLGVAIEEYVSRHVVDRGMADGTYRTNPLPMGGSSTTSPNVEVDRDLTVHTDDRVKLTRYFGLVPRELVYPSAATADLGVNAKTDTKPNEYVEVVVVVMDDNYLLKLEENPWMMGDRPVVAFQWDLMPNRFWGRGVVEKGYNAQMGLDTELRSRFDTLALTVHPMMGVDITRMPKNFKLEVGPGKLIFGSGKPSDFMEQFKIGQLDQNTWQQAAAMEKMVFQSTGALDLTGVPSEINGDATAAGMSMSISASIKRFKRTLMNFHEQLLMPAIEKTLWRYMQYDPARYPANPFACKPATLMGMVAREYEQSQLAMLLQTTGPDNPAYMPILIGLINNSSLPGRADIISAIQQGSKPSPEQQQMQQLQVREQLAKVMDLEAKAGLNMAKADYERMYKPRIDMISALAQQSNPDPTDKLVKVGELALKEKAIDQKAEDTRSNERIAQIQADAARAAAAKRGA